MDRSHAAGLMLHAMQGTRQERTWLDVGAVHGDLLGAQLLQLRPQPHVLQQRRTNFECEFQLSCSNTRDNIKPSRVSEEVRCAVKLVEVNRCPVQAPRASGLCCPPVQHPCLHMQQFGMQDKNVLLQVSLQKQAAAPAPA